MPEAVDALGLVRAEFRDIFVSDLEAFVSDHDVYDLPVFALSNEDDCVGPREEDWRGRDTIWLAPCSGTFRFAELLLNAGCSWNSVREYELEGDAGFRSVGPMSAELKIFLPGSDGWLFYPDEDVPTTVAW